MRAGIAYAPQGRRLFADLSVRENLLQGAYVRPDRINVAADLGRVLDLFPVLRELLSRTS